MKKNQIKKKEFKSPLDNPKKVKCCDCKESFELTFVVPKWDWSAKNNWFYWTEKGEDKGKYKCNYCLLDLYYNRKHDYWQLVNSARKRQQMRTYVYDGTISASSNTYKQRERERESNSVNKSNVRKQKLLPNTRNR